MITILSDTLYYSYIADYDVFKISIQINHLFSFSLNNSLFSDNMDLNFSSSFEFRFWYWPSISIFFSCGFVLDRASFYRLTGALKWSWKSQNQLIKIHLIDNAHILSLQLIFYMKFKVLSTTFYKQMDCHSTTNEQENKNEQAFNYYLPIITTSLYAYSIDGFTLAFIYFILDAIVFRFSTKRALYHVYILLVIKLNSFAALTWWITSAEIRKKKNKEETNVD